MNEGDWPRLILGSAWLLFLLGGVAWFYRGRFGQAVQQALIWVLIFLGFTLAYSLLDPLAVALNLQPAVTNNGQDIVLSRDASGHFVTRLEINGTGLPFIVDTGASQIVISQNDAERAGLNPEALTYSNRALTANGFVEIAPVRLDRVRFGPHVDRDIPATVNSAEMGISLLGMSYLERFSRIVVEGDRMILTR
jgi:aspartyl protease family protein